MGLLISILTPTIDQRVPQILINIDIEKRNWSRTDNNHQVWLDCWLPGTCCIIVGSSYLLWGPGIWYPAIERFRHMLRCYRTYGAIRCHTAEPRYNHHCLHGYLASPAPSPLQATARAVSLTVLTGISRPGNNFFFIGFNKSPCDTFVMWHLSESMVQLKFKKLSVRKDSFYGK